MFSKNTVLLPNASEELLEINIGVFDRYAANLLDSINTHVADISLPEKETKTDIKVNWFKAYIEACFNSDSDCTEFKDTYGPYQTYAECQDRAREMVKGFVNFLETENLVINVSNLFKRFC